MAILSILVVNLNEATHLRSLKEAIDGLQRLAHISLETILVDGGSTDNSITCAQTLGFSHVLEFPGATIPVCRNKGLQSAAGSWIAFLDGDCEPAPDWLMKALPFLERSAPVLIGFPVLPPTPGTWVQRYWNIHWAHKRTGHCKDAFRLITTRNMLFHRTIANQLNGFDEALTTGEDTDFALRATRAGFEVIAVPDLCVIHHGEPATLRLFFRQQLWHANRKSYGKIARATALRMGGNAVVFSLVFVGCLLLAIVASLLAIGKRDTRFVLLALPLIASVSLPAALIAFRAKSWRAFLPLCVLYTAYGLARSLDLLGLHRTKTSWKITT